MSDYVSRLKADTSQHDKAMEDSAKKVSDYKKQTDQASASVQNLTQKTSKSTSELMKEMASMENLGRSTSNYKKQLTSLQRQIADLTVNYRQMNDAEKQSSLGKEVAAKIDELKQKAAEYKDTIADVNAEIQHMASDTAGWDAIKQGINLVSSSMQTFISVSGLSADKAEKLLQVMNKVKLAEQAANTAINIGNALQRQSALMQGIKALQTRAATAATRAQTAATGKATIAQRLFNTVAKANPYVLLATAIIGIGTALVAFSKKTKEATTSLNDLKKSMDNLDEETGNSIAKFKILQGQYIALKTDAERNEWLKNNKEKFKEWGIEINNVNDANEKLVKNGDKVVEMIMLEAQAAALAGKYQEEYAKFINKQLEKQAGIISRGGNSMDSLTGSPQEIWRKAGLTVENGGLRKIEKTIQDENGKDMIVPWFEVTPEGEDMIRKYAEKGTMAAIDEFNNGMSPVVTLLTNIENKAAGIRRGLGGSGSSGSGSGSGSDALEGSITYIKSQISEAQKLRDAAVVGTQEWWNQVHALEALNEQLAEAEAKQRRLTSNFEPLAPIANPIVGLVKGPEMKLAGKSPFEKQMEQLDEWKKHYKKTMEDVASYGDILNSIGSVFNSLGQNMDENGQAWMNFAGTVAQSVSKILPQLMSLVLGNEAAAMAEGTASSASLPFPANLVAIASIIAELVAVFAAIPKFADGGIFGGNTSIGDYNIARVNSGEMILNGSQQQRLFNMINTGSGSNNSSSVNGQVEFKIRGNELVGVLNNYNSKRSKI